MSRESDHPRRITIGASACLLGQEVRYDGGHKRQAVLAELLAREMEVLAVCPESDIGLGTPREPMNLYRGEEGAVLLKTVDSGRDLTKVMKEYARLRVEELAAEQLRGFILKSGSPSCGLAKVPVYGDHEEPGEGPGLFAERLTDRFPNLPIIEESDLLDFPLLYQFLVRVYTYDRWRRLVMKGISPRDLEAFHEEHRILVEASKPGSWEALRDLTAGKDGTLPGAVADEYERRLMLILSRTSSHESNAEALFRTAFSIEKGESEGVMERVITAVDDYRSGRQSLVDAKEIVHALWREKREVAPEAAAYLNPIPRSLAEAIARSTSHG